MTAATAQARLAALSAAVTVVVAALEAEEYATAWEYEGAVNPLRTEIATLLPEISTLWGVDGWPVVKALRTLAARLLDAGAALSQGRQTVTITTSATTGLIEIAVERYRNFARWTDLAGLNPTLPHPGIIPAGTELVVYVQ